MIQGSGYQICRMKEIWQHYKDGMGNGRRLVQLNTLDCPEMAHCRDQISLQRAFRDTNPSFVDGVTSTSTDLDVLSTKLPRWLRYA